MVDAEVGATMLVGFGTWLLAYSGAFRASSAGRRGALAAGTWFGLGTRAAERGRRGAAHAATGMHGA